MKVLIVEDEQHLADGLRFNLEADGADVVTVGDGESALKVLEDTRFNAIVLDIMLPGIDGFDVARAIRSRHDFTPLLMLTARGRPEDVLEGFEAGADDYLAKPFDLEIFMARLNGLIRRREWLRSEIAADRAPSVVTINHRTIDFENLELRYGSDVTQLTLMEARLLRFLMDNEGRAVSRKTILEDVWGLQEDTDTRAIDNFVVRLRKYLENEPNDPVILKTVRGVGYKFVSPEKPPE
jgi:DNA-binding response OmpR family regulator